MPPLPTVIFAGDTGHIGHHEAIDTLLVDLVAPFVSAGIAQGPIANRPAAGVAGRYYFATDTVVVSYDDGATWHDIATSGALAAHIASLAPHSGEIPKSLLDAKGDLIIATANDVPDRLAVGSNGQVLVADSAQAKGVKWADPDAGMFHGCRLYRGAAISMNSGVSTAIPWDQEKFDTDAFHAGSSADIGIPFDGYYDIVAQVAWDGNAAGYRETTITVNGTSIEHFSQDAAGAIDWRPPVPAGVVKLFQGDIVQVVARQTAGVALNVFVGDDDTWFSIDYRGK